MENTGDDKELTLIRNDRNAVMSRLILSAPLNLKLTKVMMKFAQDRNIIGYMSDLLTGINEVAGRRTITYHCGTLTYDVRRPFKGVDGNMHWITPANYLTHMDIIRHLSFGGLGDTLQMIGNYFPNLEELTCYQIAFIGVSEYKELRVHRDLHGITDYGWNILIPIILVDESPPELMIYSDNRKKQHEVKYKLGEAVLLGSEALHSTNPVRYIDGKFRLMLSVFVAQISTVNVDLLLHDVTQKWPRSRKLLLDLAKDPHWTRENGLSMPILPIDNVVGSAWYRRFEELKAFKVDHGHFFVTALDDPGLSEWATQQRLKAKRMVSGQKCNGMCEERYNLLLSIGFPFQEKRRNMKSAVVWRKCYEELVSFHDTHKHCNVSPSHGVPRLCNWVRKQCQDLKDKLESKKLSMEECHQVELLNKLGFRWSLR